MTTQDFLILLITSTVFGTFMGAYFGTVQYRIITDEPLVTSYFFCPNCKTTLSIWFQIPILSWLFLKGKCYYCKKPIPVKYPLIEGGFLIFYLSTFLLFYIDNTVFLRYDEQNSRRRRANENFLRKAIGCLFGT